MYYHRVDVIVRHLAEKLFYEARKKLRHLKDVTQI